jgi:hypothetical protein
VIACQFVAYPSMPSKRKDSIVRELPKIDWLGATMHISTLVLFNLGLLFPGSSWAWDSGTTIAVWVLFGVFLIAYVLQQYFSVFTTPERRIFPVSVVKSRVWLLAFLCGSCAAASYGVILYYTGLYYPFTRGDGAIESAVKMLPYLCVYVLFALLAGALLPVIKVYAAVYLAGGILLTAGAGGVMSVNSQSPTSVYMGLTALLGAGVGTTFQLGVAVLGAKLPMEKRSEYSLSLNQAQYIGINTGISIAGTIYQDQGFRRLTEALDGLGFSDEQIRDALAGFESPVLLSGNNDITYLATSIVVDVIVKVFVLVLAAGALMIVCGLSMKWERLDFQTQGVKLRQEENESS